MFDVFITETARDANPAVEAYVAEYGEVVSFRSKNAAEEWASELSEDGGRVRIQKAAPQETRDINAYLVSDPRTYTSVPKETNSSGLVFDTTANQYGALGEAVVAGSYGVSPGLKYYIEQHTELPAEDEYKITRRNRPRIPQEIDYDGTWSPDLVVDVKQLEDWQTIETFYCEIKAGDASFERNQRESMQSLPREHNVLKIRVDITELPAEYRLLITPVDTA